MKISFNIDTTVAQKYLDHLNELNGGKKIMDKAVGEAMADALAKVAEDNIKKQTNNLAGFDVEKYFPNLFK